MYSLTYQVFWLNTFYVLGTILANENTTANKRDKKASQSFILVERNWLTLNKMGVCLCWVVIKAYHSGAKSYSHTL